MEKTHWKKLYNPNYFGAWRFQDGKDIVLTIDHMANEIVTGENGKKEECVVMYFREDEKPLICNVTNSKTISKLFKTPYIEEWSGRRIQLYLDKNVRFGKEIVEGVRVRDYLPAITEAATTCTGCGNIIEAAGKMNPQQVAIYTSKKFGRPLCSACAKQEGEKNRKLDVL